MIPSPLRTFIVILDVSAMTARGRARWGWSDIADPDVVAVRAEIGREEIWHVRAPNAAEARAKADVEIKRPRAGGVRIANVSRKTRTATGGLSTPRLAA